MFLLQVPRDKRDVIEIFQKFGQREKLEAEVQQFHHQARQYLARKGCMIPDKADEGPKWYRRKAFEWLVASHNQIEYITGYPGWTHFQLDGDTSKRPSWMEWPTATICIDQGSDGWCAVNFLKHKGVCTLLLKDPSRRRSNHCKLALHEAGVWPLMAIVTCVHNSDCGPWSECRWYREGIEHVHMYMKSMSCQTCPLFNELLPHILKDLHMEERMCEEGVAEEVWDLLPEAWLHKLNKISMNRWFAMTDELPHLHRIWHRRLLGTLVNCVRNGLMQSRSVMAALSKVQAAPGHNPEEDLPKEPVSHEPEALRSLRSASKNQLELNVCVLSDLGARDLTYGICQLMRPFRKAHTVANLACRSSQDALDWMVQQAAGDSFKPLPEVLGSLADPHMLVDIGLACFADVPAGMTVAQAQDPLHPGVLGQNSLANRLAAVAVALVAKNFHDVAYHQLCFPGLFPLLAKAELATEPLQLLEAMSKIWAEEVCPLTGQFWGKFKARNIFNDIYVLPEGHSWGQGCWLPVLRAGGPGSCQGLQVHCWHPD